MQRTPVPPIRQEENHHRPLGFSPRRTGAGSFSLDSAPIAATFLDHYLRAVDRKTAKQYWQIGPGACAGRASSCPPDEHFHQVRRQ